MTPKIFISALLALTFVACKNDAKTEKQKGETPKALQNQSAAYELVSGRGYEDLVENLYSEMVNKDIDLKKLEDKIHDLNKSKSDTTDLFDKFHGKNLSYFNSAGIHISQIKDSLLRQKMKSLIDNSLAKYNASIIKHNEFRKMIEARELTLTDLHNMLKILKTLPLMQEYQNANLPSTRSLEGYIQRQDEVIKFVDTLTKK